MIRVRFAPSPTGYLHVGGARTALFNWLFARKHGGKFILRIEDSDYKRSTEESTRAILSSMKWLGLTWDEGPDIGGPYGPYVQSERIDLYDKYASQLEKEGKAYKCFCTDEELEAERQAAVKAGKPPRYSGKCRHLTDEQRNRYIAEGKHYVIRLKVDEKDIVVNDLIKGPVTFQKGYVYDFILIKSDKSPTYNFGVVIDDALMKINYVIRGDDHLSNTPRQVLIYEALGFELPKFAHIPMIHGADGTRLSKRHGATAIGTFKDAGYLSKTMVNFLALLGWSSKSEEEFFTTDELIKLFELNDVVHSAAVFNFEKLNWMNGIYIRKMEEKEYLEAVSHFVKKELLDEYPEKAKKAMLAVRDHLQVLSDVRQNIEVYFNEEISMEPEAREFLLQNLDNAKKIAGAFLSLESDFEDEAQYKAFIKGVGKEIGAKGKFLFMPLRIILTGAMHGPPLFSIIDIAGIENLKKRIVRIMNEVK